MVELIVVLAIVGILAVIGILSAGHFIKIAEFRKNEENAKTAFLAAESTLTWYRSSGEWETFREEVLAKGTPNDTFGAGDERNGRIYAVTINDTGRGAAQSDSDGLARKLLEGGSYSGDFLDAAIAIEIDVETGKAYSAFYGTRCHTLAYRGADAGGELNISFPDPTRTYEARREHLLGYYAADLVNVVALKPVRLKVTTISLINSETLSLNWTSNSRHDNMDVKFAVSFWDRDANRELFSTEIGQDQRSAVTAGGKQAVELDLNVPDPSVPAGVTSIGKWTFPLSYQGTGGGSGGRYSLVLDGMMTAELTAVLEKETGGVMGADVLAQRQYSTSITRLGGKVVGLGTPRNIYAKITVEPDYTYAAGGTFTEYRASSEAVSNTENTLFDNVKDNGGVTSAGITKFRHLSNIRYYDPNAAAEFTLADGDMDWTAAGTGMYGLDVTGGGAERNLTWEAAVQEDGRILDFPSIDMLYANHTFRGESASATITNLKLGADSVPKDTMIDGLYAEEAEQKSHRAEYIGLFCETEGTVRDLTLSDPSLLLASADAGGELVPAADYDFSAIYGIGILSGRSQGTLQNISVRTSRKQSPMVMADISGGRPGNSSEAAAIGGLVGVFAAKDPATGSLQSINSYFTAHSSLPRPVLSGLTVEGTVTGKLPAPADINEDSARNYRYGVGGIFGHVLYGAGTDTAIPQRVVQIQDCRNHANVTGNLFTGGIAGSVRDAVKTDGSLTIDDASIRDCSSDGLVLCSVSPKNPDNTLEGRYFGGILGFGYSAYIHSSVSASGRGEGYSYSRGDKDAVLKGRYVGGIIGYGGNSTLAGCGTEKDGYVLGKEYVGGIAGGMNRDAQDAILGAGGVDVTTNGSNVIGIDYVGGIIGRNIVTASLQTTVRNCVNSGVVAGYGKFIGGIVGYNGSGGVILDCASNLPDHNGMLMKTIVDTWQAEGDCVGGLAGYNNGTIKFDSANGLAEQSLSGIVVGENYVGGLVGFNDTEAVLDVHYRLISGQVHGSGDGVGGLIGLNASVDVLGQTLKVRPSSVKGRYYVGGIIGANVVDLSTDMTVDGLQADNSLGSIIGDAFAGGVIGYQRTYDVEAGSPLSAGLWQGETDAKVRLLLPKLDSNKVPDYDDLDGTGLSGNEKTLTITDIAGGSPLVVNTDNNNIPVFCSLYTGGIVGYCERNSRLVLRNCVNSGALSRRSAEGTDKDELISLTAYLHSDEVNADITDLGSNTIEVSIGGGIIGANLDHQVVDHCENRGAMRGFIGLGGIVGFNAGGVFNCTLYENFGNASLDYIGGITGLNVEAGSWDALKAQFTYGGKKEYRGKQYTSGTVASCGTASYISVAGRSYVGGIAGYNMSGGCLDENSNLASVSAAGDYVGGIAGANSGEILQMSAGSGEPAVRIVSNKGQGIGGIAGWNQYGGSINVKSSDPADNEVVVVSAGVTVIGRAKVGGIVGIHGGSLGSPGSGQYLVCQANRVQATEDYSGGIIGVAESEKPENKGSIFRAVNRAEEVTADQGRAGGIVAVNGENFTITECTGQGNVNSDQGYAGGIAAENHGTIMDCTVKTSVKTVTVKPDQEGAPSTTKQVDVETVISSHGADAIGAVCAVNYGYIINSMAVEPGSSGEPGDSAASVEVCLDGDAGIVGGVAGKNAGGTIMGNPVGETQPITYMPYVEDTGSNRTVGIVAGQNEKGAGNKAGTISDITVSGESVKEFKNYRYLGGIVGRNVGVIVSEDGVVSGASGDAVVKDCIFEKAAIEQTSGSEAGNCYGGIAGSNSGILNGCGIQSITMTVQGVYTATTTGTAEDKEDLSTHVGGIAGKNETGGFINECLVRHPAQGEAINCIQAQNGMAGGVAGYNKGRIELSGDEVTARLMKDSSVTGAGEKIHDVKSLLQNAAKADSGVARDENFVDWQPNGGIEKSTYNVSGKQVYEESDGGSPRTMRLIMSNNGSLGGITAYNAGSVNYCASGNWYLNNLSLAVAAGTGGIIGMNESDEDLSFLLNQAFVGRELNSGGNPDRFAGGIIGSQNNTTGSGWVIKNCVNYGTVYSRYTDNSGGIMGQWSGRGGSIENCHNYGNMQTTVANNNKGASGGIVAQLYHAYQDNEYNIVGCENHGNIYNRNGNGRIIYDSNETGANDSAGILGNVTAYKAGSEDRAQRFTINVIDCVNGAGVEIYSKSMASGIVGYFSCDDITSYNSDLQKSTANIVLNIERCRNYAKKLKGGQFVAGIFGDRYGWTGASNTVLKYCFSVNRGRDDYFGEYWGKEKCPIVSFQNGGQSKYEAINNQDTNNTFNYFLSDNSVQTFNNNSSDNQGNDDLRRVNSAWVYSVVKGQKRYFLYINYGTRNVTFADLDLESLNPGDEIRKKNENAVVGRLLFTTPAGAADYDYSNMVSVVEENVYEKRYGTEDSIFDDYVREFCYREAQKLLPPKKAALSKNNDNEFTVKVEAPAYPAGDVSYEAEVWRIGKDGSESQIPAGNITLPSGGTINAANDTFTFSGDDCTFTLADAVLQQGGEVYVKVRAVHTTGGRSDQVESNRVSIGGILPDPVLLIELVERNNSYAYRLRLKNANENGYAGGTVTVKRLDGGEISFGVNDVGYVGNVNIPLQQLTVQVKNGAAASAAAAVPVYLPGNYLPMIAVNSGSGRPTYTVTGTSLADMRISVTIPGGSGSITTPPIYRAELVGTWKDDKGTEHKGTVFRSTDILTTANGTTTVVFTGLPAYMAGDESLDLTTSANITEDLKIRVWYAQSGLGPVYTYSDLDASGAPVTEGAADSKILSGKADTSGGYTYTWDYLYAPVLKTNRGTFNNYKWESGEILRFLPAPKLMEKGRTKENPLDPVMDKDHLTYTFSWDEDTYRAGDSYTVSLAGIVRNQDGDVVRKVSLETNRSVDGKSLTVDAENWSYSEVELTVTRKGSSGTTPTIGLTSSQIYAVKSRLPQPSQPRAANADKNELNYTIEWDPINPETGCGSYEVYVKSGDKVVKIAEAKTTDKTGGIYKQTVNLDDYADKKVQIYVVAKPAADEKLYVQSVDGIILNLSMPGRIETPKFTEWIYNWFHPTVVKTVEQFENGKTDGLTVTATADSTNELPGGSSYLLKGYVFDTEPTAADIGEKLNKGKEPDGALTAYPSPVGGEVVPVSMTTSDGIAYSHSLSGLSAAYAGKYIVFAIRVSSGDGKASSEWTVSDPYRLPRVQIDKPDVKTGTKEFDADVALRTNPDMPDDEQTQTWTASHTVLTWDSVDYADSYGIALKAKAGAADAAFRIREENGSVHVYKEDGGMLTEISGTNGEFELEPYKNEITGTYAGETGSIAYKTVLGARLLAEKKANGGYSYTLVLPDADALSPKDGGNSITDSSKLRYTDRAEVWADVRANEQTPGSEAYVRSDSYERNF